MLFFGDSSGRIYMTDELLNPLGMFQVKHPPQPTEKGGDWHQNEKGGS